MKTNRIMIVGGGSAGWMTAATLISQFPHKEITLIESPEIPTVGVGESTLGQINRWLQLLGIQDKDFMKHCDASYKLSIRFEDFYEKGDGGFHYPFGEPVESDGHISDFTSPKELWFLKKHLYPETPVTDYADSHYRNMAYVHENRIDVDNLVTAYHFDATKFGLWLRDHYCIPLGVKHIREDIIDIEKDETGIVSLNGHTADMYIDCTGFKSMLMRELYVKFLSYNDMLPNNKAWATRVPYKNKEEELQPYTNCTAIENGWVWNIPSWERIGTGYVYSDRYVDDEQALKEFKKHLDGKGSDYSQSEFKNISMRVGRHEKFFVKNVCAIGLSAGFIEPLESNGLLSVHEFLINLVKVMKRGDKLSQWDRDNFNTESCRFFDEFAEFVALHYALSHRDDTKYWQDISNREFKIAKQDILTKMGDDKFKSNSGHHVIGVGMRYFGVDILGDVRYNDYDLKKIHTKKNLIAEWNSMASKAPKLLDYLKDYIHV